MEYEDLLTPTLDAGSRARSWSQNKDFQKLKSVELDAENDQKEQYIAANARKIRDINRTVLTAFSLDGENIDVQRLFNALSNCGLRPFRDPRLKSMIEEFLITKTGSGEKLYTSINLIKQKPLKSFETMPIKCINIINRALLGDLVIPKFAKFVTETTTLYEQCQKLTTGMNTHHIPQLQRVDPEKWGVSICTVDGQRTSFGDHKVPVTLQACSGAINYALAVTKYGSKKVHEHVGKEPCSSGTDSITLDKNNLPHNPLIQSGGMSIASLLLQENMDLAETFDDLLLKYKRMAGGGHVNVNNAVFIAEKAISDRKFSIGYLLKEKHVFPDATCMATVLDLYFQLCSLEINCESGAVIAATLANGGTCPISEDKVLSHRAVQNTLSIMHMNGMYGFSGEWMFDIGLPAKSSNSGLILIVVPGVLGMCLWSPPLDESRNSARGVEFTRLLTKTFALQDNNVLSSTSKYNIINKRQRRETREQTIMNIIFAAAKGDAALLTRYFDQGEDLNVCDYDGRTALHLASTTGHSTIVRCLIDLVKVEINPLDRWNHTPYDDALKNKHTNIVDFLKQRGGYEGPGCITVNVEGISTEKSKSKTQKDNRSNSPVRERTPIPKRDADVRPRSPERANKPKDDHHRHRDGAADVRSKSPDMANRGKDDHHRHRDGSGQYRDGGGQYRDSSGKKRDGPADMRPRSPERANKPKDDQHRHRDGAGKYRDGGADMRSRSPEMANRPKEVHHRNRDIFA